MLIPDIVETCCYLKELALLSFHVSHTMCTNDTHNIYDKSIKKHTYQLPFIFFMYVIYVIVLRLWSIFLSKAFAFLLSFHASI